MVISRSTRSKGLAAIISKVLPTIGRRLLRMPLTLQKAGEQVTIYAIIVHYQDRTAYKTGFGAKGVGFGGVMVWLSRFLVW